MIAPDLFQQKLAFGQIGESLIARYLRSRGWSILPVYEKEIDNGKGPRLFLPYGYPETELIAPDLQGMKYQKVQWFEAKHKSAATFYRKKWRWQTGIDKRHYLDYKRVQEITTYPVWLLFLQRESACNNAPLNVPSCPTGLYGCPITQLYSDEGYYDRGGKRYYMVYWGVQELKKLASLEEVLQKSECV
jgi:hypothetical protein